ncbi:unnamed protein product [Brachionus calyciflorus]|uniref:Uncharacterized protein n=1 Tax=Brachionus calyciflorus TaxID=104777 RepID=A0A814BB68_9BILA|nr:unnamed protein product [Brachionus calyciflorus]
MNDHKIFPHECEIMKTDDYVVEIKTKKNKDTHINCVKITDDQNRQDLIHKSRNFISLSEISWFDDKDKSILFEQEYFTNTPYLDKPLGIVSPENSKISKINFEQIAKRSFYFNTIFIERDGGKWPINPIGSTGLRGRGILDKWGANHYMHLVITRWKKNEDGGICLDTRDMRPILEAICFENSDQVSKEAYGPDGYFFPNTPYTFGTDLMFNLCISKIQEIMPELLKENPGLDFLKLNRVYYGYLDDNRNTDNAWIETQCFNIHLSDKLENLNISNKNYQWKIVDSKEPFYQGVHDLLRLVSKSLGAHF